MKQGCLDIFEGIRSDVMYTAQYDDGCDMGTTCIGVHKMRRQDELKAKYKAPITEDCDMPRKLVNGLIVRCYLTQEQLSHLCLKLYLNCPSLHSSPKFLSKTEYISRQWSVSRFIICHTFVITLQGYRFEVYMFVSEIHDNVDVVMLIEMCIK